MFCQKCGNQLPDGSNFCNKCGTALDPNLYAETINPQSTAQTTTESSPYSNPQTTTYYNPQSIYFNPQSSVHAASQESQQPLEPPLPQYTHSQPTPPPLSKKTAEKSKKTTAPIWISLIVIIAAYFLGRFIVAPAIFDDDNDQNSISMLVEESMGSSASNEFSERVLPQADDIQC